jgi:DNA invertase Pin-like site-specific DNA recombinase
VLLDGYIRVSHVGDRKGETFISPTVQREQIEAWIESNQSTVGEIFEELDVSGADGKRPLLIRVIERIETGESKGVVVARLDRFGRSVVDGLRAIERIREAGGTFVSVQDNLDIETPTGKLILQILFSIGEWQLERIRSGWDVAKARAISRGVYVGQTPFGYRRGEDGRLRIDPGEAVIIDEIFTRRAAGESYAAIAGRLNEAGHRSMTGVAFSAGAVMRMIKNPAYRGEARNGAHKNRDAHPPIVDSVLWQSVQVWRRAVASRKNESLLVGMIRCATCGRMMQPTRPGKVRKVRHYVYRCGTRDGKCGAPAYVRADELEPLVEEFVFTRRSNSGQGASGGGSAPEEAAVAAAEAELAAYRDEPLLLSTLGAASYAEGIATRQHQLEVRLLELALARRRRGAPRVDVEALKRSWAQLDWQQRRRALGELIDFVIVGPGSGTICERAEIFRRGRGPVVGLEGKPLTPFDRARSKGERLAVPRRWGLRRLEEELRSFLAERQVWPDYLEFAAAGRGRLHAQVLLWGGPYYWSAKFGLQIWDKAVVWSEDRVEAALAPFLAGHQHWPPRGTFEEAGLHRVYVAAQQHGGIAHWAKRFGLAYRAGRRYPWPPERIEREVLRVSGDSGEFPSHRELREKGPKGLAEGIRREGGTIHWADRLGLRLSPERRRRAR